LKLTKEDDNAITRGSRGRRHGEQRNLTAEQEAEIKRLLIDKALNEYLVHVSHFATYDDDESTEHLCDINAVINKVSAEEKSRYVLIEYLDRKI
jgi:hypothetical protein